MLIKIIGIKVLLFYFFPKSCWDNYHFTGSQIKIIKYLLKYVLNELLKYIKTEKKSSLAFITWNRRVSTWNPEMSKDDSRWNQERRRLQSDRSRVYFQVIFFLFLFILFFTYSISYVSGKGVYFIRRSLDRCL
jgi:hypothetical protein